MTAKNLAELRAQSPELAATLVREAVQEHSSSEQAKAEKAELERLRSENKAFAEKLAAHEATAVLREVLDKAKPPERVARRVIERAKAKALKREEVEAILKEEREYHDAIVRESGGRATNLPARGATDDLAEGNDGEKEVYESIFSAAFPQLAAEDRTREKAAAAAGAR